MPSDLSLFNSILHLHLRPWKATESEQKFRQLLHSLPKENYHQQPLYEVSFPKPLSEKTKYYHAIINNEATTYLSTLHQVITASSNNNEKKFHIHTALSKRLKAKLEDTQRVIGSSQLFFSIIDENRHDKQLRDNTWIIQYLKYQLIRLYLEIQNSYPEYLNDNPLTEDDIHLLYFSENNAGRKLITKLPIRQLKKSGIKSIRQEEVKFTPIRGELREKNTKILTYQEIVANPDKFASIELQLFNEKLITGEYDFINKGVPGNVQRMAAVYQVLIKKRYFNEFSFPGRKQITDLQIRSFLNYRYNAKIDKEFRKFGNKEKGRALLEAYIDKNLWLQLLPPGKNT